MKARIRLATKDQYCFIETETEGTPEEIVTQYGELYRAYWKRGGIATKQFHEIFDNYLWKNRAFSEQEYNDLSDEQKWIINEVKKSKNRAQYQIDKENKGHATVISKIADSAKEPKEQESTLEIIKITK